MGDVTAKKVRNLGIFLGLGLLQLIVVFEGLAEYFGITAGLLEIQFILLGFVAAGLFFISTF